MSTATSILSAIAEKSLLLFLIIGSIFALLLGLLFILSPRQAAALSLRYSHWHSLRRPSRPLEIPRSVDPYLYRQHRLVGLVILLSASYILYRFAFSYDSSAALHTLTPLFGNALVSEWLLAATLWFILPVSGLLLLFGSAMALKPSTLRGVERWANHWVSTRKFLQPLEKQNKSLDNWVARHPRPFGILLILAAGYNLAILLLFYMTKA
jgi:hypothetical protein